MSLWSLVQSARRIAGGVLVLCTLYVVGLGIGSAWFYLVGWNWKAWPAVVLFSPLAFWSLVFIFTYMQTEENEHGGVVSAHEWRVLFGYAMVVCATPVGAHLVGGWPREHQFSVLALVLAGVWLFSMRRAYSALGHFGRVLGRGAARLPPGSSSTRLS